MRNIYLIISILFRLTLCRTVELNLNSDNGYISQQKMENININNNNMISTNARGFSNQFVGQINYPAGLSFLENARKPDANVYSNLQVVQPYEYSNRFQNSRMDQVGDSNRLESQNVDNSNQIITNDVMQKIPGQILEESKSTNDLKNEQNHMHNVNEIEQIGEKIEAILSQTGQTISNRGNLEMGLNYGNMNPNDFLGQKEPINQNMLAQNHDIQIGGKNLNQLAGNLNEQRKANQFQYPNENSGYLPPINREHVPVASQQYLSPSTPDQSQHSVKIETNNMLNSNQNSYGALPQPQIPQFGMQNNLYFQPDKLRNALLSENHPEQKTNLQHHESNMLNDAANSSPPINYQTQMPSNQYNEIDENSNNNIRVAANIQLLDTMFTQYQGQNILPENNFKLQPQIEPTKKPIVHTSIYSYGPPEETEEDEQAEMEELGQKNINYKVIFIRAPHQITKNTLQLAKSLNNEQTVIYVLSKKTDPNEIREAIDAIPKPTIKPEVHFVKYKTNEEAIYAQNQIQAQYNSLGGTTLVNREEIAPIHVVNRPSSGPY